MVIFRTKKAIKLGQQINLSFEVLAVVEFLGCLHSSINLSILIAWYVLERIYWINHWNSTERGGNATKKVFKIININGSWPVFS